MEQDEKFMKAALVRAKRALREGEVPVGAVVVLDGKIIGSGYNRRARAQLARAHAEMYAIDQACRKMKSWRLEGCDLYVTLEPCPMCMGAALNARIRRVVFGAYEQKGRSLTAELAAGNLLNHTLAVKGGVLAEECSTILTGFFRGVRRRAAPGSAEQTEDAGNGADAGGEAGEDGAPEI